MKTQRKYLASANTSSGFINCFDNINTQKKSFCFILKGGPGTGKSSLMKKVAQHFEKLGQAVEYFYCSSDADSLDGIRIKNFSIVDGTAPHTTEPTMPGIKERIINVGEFIKDDIKNYKTIIENLMRKKSLCFKLAYKYFSLFKILTDIQLKQTNNQQKEKSSVINISQNNKKIKDNSLNNKSRKLFASYISPNGFKSFYKQNNYKNVIVLKGNFIEQFKTLKNIEQKLKEENTLYTKFLSVFDPSLAEAVYNEKTHTLYVCEDVFEQKPKFKNKILTDFIIKKVSNLLAKAKHYHKKIESYYITCMDFDKLNMLTKNIINEIENKI